MTALSQCILRPPAAAVVQAPNSTSAATAFAADSGQVAQVISLDPDPNIPYQPVQLIDVVDDPVNYSAILSCKRDSAGELSLNIKLNPQRHSIEKINLLYVGTSPKQALKQIGNGTGHYDPKTQRYNFSAIYQVISELPDKRQYHSELYPINGWISTRTNTAAVQPLKP